MTILTPLSIANYAAGAGFSGQQVATATAIAMAESGGNTSARGDNGTSYGVWQIHLPAHPEFVGQNLDDPGVNARAAFRVFQKQGWGAWSVYNGLRYWSLLPAAEAAALAASPLGGAAPQVANDAAQPAVDAASAAAGAALKQAAALSGFLSDLQNPLIWVRVLKVLAGAGMIIVGLQLVAQRAVLPAVEPLTGPAVKIAKKAAVAAA